MIAFVDLCIDMQKSVIDAHEKSLTAMRAGSESADAGMAMQKAMTETARANVAAWERWVNLWTGRK